MSKGLQILLGLLLTLVVLFACSPRVKTYYKPVPIKDPCHLCASSGICPTYYGCSCPAKRPIRRGVHNCYSEEEIEEMEKWEGIDEYIP